MAADVRSGCRRTIAMIDTYLQPDHLLQLQQTKLVSDVRVGILGYFTGSSSSRLKH